MLRIISKFYNTILLTYSNYLLKNKLCYFYTKTLKMISIKQSYVDGR